ncbi:MAG: Dam family site-specific DNA-(adenine-N6)-methyltransferase [Candidatus Omnitrophota bacterium]|jgi:DNA adenine methylase
MSLNIFRYPGGKSKASIRDWILSQMPDDTLEYREPFVGGGGIFFAVPQHLRRWINDIHPGLIAVYKALKRNDGFIESCKRIKAAQPTEPLNGRYNARLGRVFDRFKANEQMDQALRYFFLNRTVFAGRVNYAIPSRLYYSHPDGWNIVNTTKLEQASDCLQHVKITCRDYAHLLSTPGEKVWVYIDPPYVVNTNLTASSQLYQYNFTLDDHRLLATRIRDCQHRVCVSYDDHPLIRELYKDFRILNHLNTNCGTTNSTKQRVTELLILNY